MLSIQASDILANVESNKISKEEARAALEQVDGIEQSARKPPTPAITFYSNGIAARNDQGEIISLVGKIAETWLQQGLDAGPLGMPITREYYPTTDVVRVDFEGGSITYNPVTNAVDISTR